jgi:hypothetical protein
VLIPERIGVLFGFQLESGLADWTDNHEYAVVIAWERAFVVCCPRMGGTVDLLAAVTFEGEEVLLMAKGEVAVLTNMSKFHDSFC